MHHYYYKTDKTRPLYWQFSS